MAAGDFTNTAIVPVLFQAAQEVSNEPCGMLDAITLDKAFNRVAYGDTIKVPYAPTRTLEAFTPATVAPLGAEATAAAVSVSIQHTNKVSWPLSGEQVRSLENGGNYQDWMSQMTKQGIRTLRNDMAAHAAVAANEGASRAIGTVDTTPFASDMSAITAVRKILRDNGAPMVDLQLVTDTAAYINLLNLGLVNQSQIAGSDAERRSGKVMQQFGFTIREDANIAAHTCGTGTGYQVHGTTAARETAVTTEDGSGTILAGDFCTMSATDTRYYGVGTGITEAGAGLVLNRPGLITAKADNDVITIIGVSDTFQPTLAFERGSIIGVVRPTLIPQNATIQQQIVTDANGISYLFLICQQYGITTFEIHQAYGFKAVQTEHIACIIG